MAKNIRFLQFAVRVGLCGAFWRGPNLKTAAKQATLTWSVPFPHVSSATALAAWLRERGVSLVDAEHTLYIPPQDVLKRVVPEICRFYPVGSGFKILKDLRGPRDANYLAGRSGSVYVRRRLTGSPAEQLITANYMHSLGIGPRAWDVCRWSGAGNDFTVFVVEHIEGSVPTAEECEEFLGRLRVVTDRSPLRILIPDWESQDDFECPGCRGNLFTSPQHPDLQYVDFQNFRLSNPANWTREIVANAMSNGEPSKKSRVELSSEMIDRLACRGIGLQDRVVMHLHCGQGEILRAALAHGAAWAIGSTDDSARPIAESSLYSSGMSRFTLLNMRELTRENLTTVVPPTISDRLDESILFCGEDQPVEARNGFSLEHLPWRYLITDASPHGLHERGVPIARSLPDCGR